ncbi:gamma-glutamyl-gamma-aminobutyrate hydrolase family protein [Subtercola sp. YIM 133946]|uniref:gamma-glutamyl-gamma-aminobutyrate hydrolase family protein n=1 Tax=Subtercola sp. YIM 133946 TaxID=3118909 RepID=UPI002F95E8D8
MPTPTTTLRLAVVEVTRHRAHDTEYHAYIDILNSRMVAEGRAQGYEVTRIAAADVGTDELLDVTRDADAIVIMGGEDIAPRYYGGAAGYPAEGRHYEAADEAQIALVRRAVETSTPLLGICRGLQVINVALGGTLVQDLGSATIHKHLDVPIDETMSGHTVALDPASRLYGVLGDAVTVQSAHHQAVDALGSSLIVVATADDGLPEAVEHAHAPVVGIQWHPEDAGAPAGQLASLVGSLREWAQRGVAADSLAA